MPLHLNRGMCKLKVGKLDDALWDTVGISTYVTQHAIIALPYHTMHAATFRTNSIISGNTILTTHRIANDVSHIILPHQSECNTMRLPCRNKTTVINYITIQSYGMATPVLQPTPYALSCYISHTQHNGTICTASQNHSKVEHHIDLKTPYHILH
jgi:hypothetical protein